jgi:hypothetical protein
MSTSQLSDTPTISNACHRRRVILLFFTIISVFCLSAAYAGITLQAMPTRLQLPLGEGVYRALIIGNDHYDDPQKRWPSLNTAVNDARAVRQLLEQDYGFSDVTFF